MILIVTALWTPMSVNAATDLTQAQELFANDSSAGDFYGRTLAIDGDLLAVGAPDVSPGLTASGPGAVYVYRLDNGNWSQEEKLVATDGFLGQQFGGGVHGVAVRGDTIVVGAPGDDDHGTDSGAAYVFTHNGTDWSDPPQKLDDPNGQAGDGFGEHVELSDDGTTLLVAAATYGATNQGKVFVYEYDAQSDSWGFDEALVPDVPQVGAAFGNQVRIAQNTIVVSAWQHNNSKGVDAGSLYVFERTDATSPWMQAEVLELGAGGPNLWFGWAMDLSPDGKTIVASTAAGLEGGVYGFQRSGSGWVEFELPHPVDTGPWLMGDSIALSDDTLVIGHSAMNQEAGGAYIYRRSGATWTYAHRLQPDDGAQGDWYAHPQSPDEWGDWAGTAVAMSGANIAIGSPNHDHGGLQSGGAYVFEDPGWTLPAADRSEQQELVASDAAAGDQHGQTIDVDGDTMVVGAPGVSLGSGNDGAGAAYVYRLANGVWSEEAKLTSGADVIANQRFGGGSKGVAVRGDTVVVGANGDDEHGAGSGVAYVFTHNGSDWSDPPQKLHDPNGQSSDLFGQFVEIGDDGTTILVGAANHGPTNQGKVFVFVYDAQSESWVLDDELTPDLPQDGAQFGYQARIAGNTIVVSAWQHDNSQGTDAGSLYVFERADPTSPWTQTQVLELSAGGPNLWFGWAMDLSPDANTIVASTAAGLAGGVYIFERSGSSWVESQLAHPVDTGAWLMGDSIAMSDDTLVIGHSALNEEIGGAYIYRHDGSSWNLARRLVPSDGRPGDWYAHPQSPDDWGDWAGTAVAMSGSTIAIGSPNHDDGGLQSGSAYFFHDPGPAPDQDDDGLSDSLESSLDSNDPTGDNLVVSNTETGDAAYAEGTVAEGITLYSGSFTIEFPPDSSVDTGSGAEQIEVTMIPGETVTRIEISGADLNGGTKSVTVPFDGDAPNPAVCIDDSAAASIDTVLDENGCTSGVEVPIPATVGASNVVVPYTVTRLVDDRTRVEGLSHTALATLSSASAAPVVGSIAASSEPVPVGSTISVDTSFSDADDAGAHVATWSWGDGSSSAGTVDQTTNTVAGSHSYSQPGVYTLSATVTDANGAGASASAVHQYIVVYDPDGGFVTGGGWIDSPAGAFAADANLTGTATFGFVAKYQQGQSTPSGKTEFHFKAGDLRFKSNAGYMWLVVSGSGHKATYKGSGTVNGQGNYGFLVSAIDETNTSSTDDDLFRIKIWDKDAGDAVIYDNHCGSSGEDADPCTALGGGNIKIHKP